MSEVMKEMLVEELERCIVDLVKTSDNLALAEVDLDSAIDGLLIKLRKALAQAGVFVKIELDHQQTKRWQHDRFVRKGRKTKAAAK